jgi:hypothetical protein
VRERPDGVTIIAGAGSNDTRHAVELTQRAGELGVDAVLSVTPYYNRPNRRGILAHFEAVAAASTVPVVLYNIPSRTGTDMPNDLLAAPRPDRANRLRQAEQRGEPRAGRGPARLRRRRHAVRAHARHG